MHDIEYTSHPVNGFIVTSPDPGKQSTFGARLFLAPDTPRLGVASVFPAAYIPGSTIAHGETFPSLRAVITLVL